MITEETLRNFLERFGQVKYVIVRKHHIANDDVRSFFCCGLTVRLTRLFLSSDSCAAWLWLRNIRGS